MGMSAFDVIGPTMVGPSSSHTAGAARMGLVTVSLFGAPLRSARIDLHGSFAATGRGHATDRAIVAGLLGFSAADERLKDSLALADAAGVTIKFREADLGDDVHPNTARIRAEAEDGEIHEVVASSVGGGMIQVGMIDGFTTSFSGDLESVVLWHDDRSGFLAKVTALLACVEANIATIRTSRAGRGTSALTVIEIDAPLPPDCLSLLGRIHSTRNVRAVPRIT